MEKKSFPHVVSFTLLLWQDATKRDTPVEPINMELKINADSTAFILKNLEDIDFTNGNASVRRVALPISDKAVQFSHDSTVNIKAKETLVLPFNRFKGTDQIGRQEILSKNVKLESFVYELVFTKNSATVGGLFQFKF